MDKTVKRWLGVVPENCDTCGQPIAGVFYDAATKYRRWACMCKTCQTLGPGLNKLGPGIGQEYTDNGEGQWLKTAG